MSDEITLCTCPRCRQKNPLGVSITKKVALSHQRAFLWAQQLEEQIDDSYINFNTRHLKKKKNDELNYKLNCDLSITNIEANKFDEENYNLNITNLKPTNFNEENYNYQYEEYNDFIEEAQQLSSNLSQNSSIYTDTDNNSSEASFNSQNDIEDLYQDFVTEEFTNDMLSKDNEGWLDYLYDAGKSL
ncbi:22473_t:CDS:2 [Cetraspora pellucida]|uniref:22473_t:CDS:1 n=1 Tax=Cetraspora pellucida TaxID=1433469 RepID=A0A9N9N6M4_9GLOM|nr:22473_t:CDS:2 [Cetraspora pellucida]